MPKREQFSQGKEETPEEKRERFGALGLNPKEIEEAIQMNRELSDMGPLKSVEKERDWQEAYDMNREIDEAGRKAQPEKSELERREANARQVKDLMETLLEKGIIPPDMPASEIPAFLDDYINDLEKEKEE